MTELINFIPRDTAGCRSLLVSLRDATEGIDLTDRYGQKAHLTPDEIKSLSELIESQIGEKTPIKQTEKKPETTKKTTKK